MMKIASFIAAERTYSLLFRMINEFGDQNEGINL